MKCFSQVVGFTLVELVIAIAVAGIVISGVVVTSGQIASRSSDPLMSVQRIHIAQSYLDEIGSQEFALNGVNCNIPAGGRSEFTHICQYDSIQNEVVQDQFGSTPAGLSQYRVWVSISNIATGASGLGVAGAYVPNSATALVTVTVRSPDNSTTSLSGYFVNGT